mgnify:CR=1 FL=1
MQGQHQGGLGRGRRRVTAATGAAGQQQLQHRLFRRSLEQVPGLHLQPAGVDRRRDALGVGLVGPGQALVEHTVAALKELWPAAK